MIFIGQPHIINALRVTLTKLDENPDMGWGLLVEGPSGYGKTTLCKGIAQFLAGQDYEKYVCPESNFLLQKRVIFIDEAHKLENPEKLYPILDEGRKVIILATNENGGLPEPLVNRCERFTFSSYTDRDLLLICKDTAEFKAPDESFMEIINAGNRNPRVITKLVQKIGWYFTQNNIKPDTANFKSIIEDVFYIKDGMDTLCLRYLEILKSIGGIGSFSLIRNLLHADPEILTNWVEPILVSKGKIEITKKGRKLC